MATLLKTEGTRTEVTPANGTDFKLEELYSMLGCEMVEVVYLSHNTGDEDPILICDEEGRLIDEPQVNPEASRMFEEAWGYGDIVGNAVLCKSKEFR